ncbi:DUF4360 domain-containing protein [Actinomadura terrae]|uniref:DUF4360 domain-containing protein n=1 Tax=Actinomadura terrae TaxID=604353 RepID=UPI001FA762B0|nr:DUF4360 domain-containing protein [Actinomadura terrae]
MRKVMSVLGVAVAAISVTAMPASAGSRLVLGPEAVTVKLLSVAGSGCPADTVSVKLKSHSDLIEIGYSYYVAQAGGSSSPTESRKNCQVSLDVRYPQGFVYAISQVRNYGYAALRDGATALYASAFYFQGAADPRELPHELPSGSKGVWVFTETVPEQQLVWTRCGEARALNIRTDLRVKLGTSDATKVSLITIDSADDVPGTSYQLVWKKCP